MRLSKTNCCTRRYFSDFFPPTTSLRLASALHSIARDQGCKRRASRLSQAFSRRCVAHCENSLSNMPFSGFSGRAQGWRSRLGQSDLVTETGVAAKGGILQIQGRHYYSRQRSTLYSIVLPCSERLHTTQLSAVVVSFSIQSARIGQSSADRWDGNKDG